MAAKRALRTANIAQPSPPVIASSAKTPTSSWSLEDAHLVPRIAFIAGTFMGWTVANASTAIGSTLRTTCALNARPAPRASI